MCARLGDCGNRLLRAPLQGRDMGLGIASGLLSLARQRTHLVGHYRKTTPTLTSPRRLDGRVEREQVGLLGN